MDEKKAEIRRKKIEQEGGQKETEEGKKRSKETEEHEKQLLAALKGLKQGNDKELEGNLRLGEGCVKILK